MGLAVLLAIIFAGIQGNPAGFIAGQAPIVTKWPLPGTTYVSGPSFHPKHLMECGVLTRVHAGMGAFLNITYTFVGQITLPSFIAEMKEPKDFPKGTPHAFIQDCC
jgi:hypothetical protein